MSNQTSAISNPRLKQLKGVCIGAGYFSYFQYEAWTRIPEIEIVAFSNRDPVKAAEITKKFGHTKLSTGQYSGLPARIFKAS